MHSQSSSVYTFQKPTTRKRKYLASTITLGVLSLLGAAGIDLALNPNALTVVFGATGASNSNGTQSATGTAVESGYGPVQVKVTKTAGKITAIDLVQAQATGGREAAFSMLVDAALSANGTNFSNISGATYTTNAFKQSMESALSQMN